MSETNEIKLKPCPFCGHEADINVSKFNKQVFCPNCGAANVWGEDAIKRWNKRKKEIIKNCPICGAKALVYRAYDSTFCVQCRKCCLTSPYKRSRKDAITAWNRRVQEDERD